MLVTVHILKLNFAERPLSVRSLIEHVRGNPLLINSVSMMSTTGITAGIGYLYWIIAARNYLAHDIGLASALIGAMTLVATLANLGIHTTFVQVLPHREAGYAWSVTINAGLAGGAVTGVVGGCLLAVVLPRFSPQFAIVAEQPIYAIDLIVGVPLMTLAMLVDYIFVAERVAGGMLVRNAVFAALKIPLLVLPLLVASASAIWILSSWVLACGISIVGTAVVLVPRLKRGYYLAVRGIVGQVRAMLPSFGWHHLINLGATAPAYLLPVMVTARLSAIDNAYFYTTWMVGSLFYTVGPAVATSLFAEGSHQGDRVLEKLRTCAWITAVFIVPAALVCLFGGRLILSLFGPRYAEHGMVLLTILVASAVPDAITNIYVAVLRVQRRFGMAALLNLGVTILILTLAWALLPRLGIAGAGWACLLALTAGSLVAGAHVVYAGVSKRTGVRAA